MTATTTGLGLTEALRQHLTRVVAIAPAVLEPVLAALFAGGHVLIEGVPGVGKTLFARALARLIGGSYKRIQFTNDLMPADIVGSVVWRAKAEKFVLVRGPLFANVALCDEVNRTSPRTLSCLLEAMENGVVTIEGRQMSLGDPFLVLATRNGIEFHGTYPLPEAALDRFLVRVEMGYPEAARELTLYAGHDPEQLLAELPELLQPAELRGLRQAVQAVVVRAPIANYCYQVVKATRQHEGLRLGASPRAALAWLRAARARAFLDGRAYVLPDDMKALAPAVLAHRLLPQGGGSAVEIVAEIVGRTPVEL